MVQSPCTQLTTKLDEDQCSSQTANGYTTWRYPVQMTFQADVETLNVPLQLTASVSINDSEHRAETELTWQPEREFLTTPSRVVLPVSSEGIAKTATIEVKRIDGEPWSIRRVTSQSDRLKPTLVEPQVGKECQIVQVSFVGSPNYKGRFTSLLTIRTDSEIEPKLYIPIAVVAIEN